MKKYKKLSKMRKINKLFKMARREIFSKDFKE